MPGVAPLESSTFIKEEIHKILQNFVAKLNFCCPRQKTAHRLQSIWEASSRFKNKPELFLTGCKDRHFCCKTISISRHFLINADLIVKPSLLLKKNPTFRTR